MKISGSNVLDSIIVEDLEQIESDKTEVGNETTEKELSYKAPTELGDDLLSFTIKLEGDLYKLPAPMSAFLDNGFTITDPPPSYLTSTLIYKYLPGMTGTRPRGLFLSLSQSYIYLKKGNITYAVDAFNYSDKPLVIEKCFVTGIQDPSDHKETADFVLPGDITFGTSENILLDKFGNILEKIKYSGDGLGYRYTNDRMGQQIDILLDFNTKLVNSIEIRNPEYE